jgi:chemotaxis protein MotB
MAAMAALSFGCQNMTAVQKGAAVGGLVGAAAGGWVSYASSGVQSVEGIPMGIFAGGLAGALVSDHLAGEASAEDYMRQIEELTAERDALAERLRAVERENESLHGEVATLQRRIQALESEIERLKAEIARLSAPRPEATPIATMEFSADVLFTPGSDVLTDAGTTALDQAVRTIQSRYADKLIRVEGHTDNDPIAASGWKSNWELGAARSLAVLHYVVDTHGVANTRVSAITYGEYQPKASNATPEGKSQNRRAVIKIFEP